MVSTLVIDERALPTLETTILENTWFSQFEWPTHIPMVKRVEIGDRVYLLSRKADLDSKLLIINVPGVFGNANSPKHTFDRIIRVALSTFEKTIAVPILWRPYNEGTRYSVYAQPTEIGKGQRLYVERWARETQHVYAYAVTDSVEDFDSLDAEWRKFDRATNGLVDALIDQEPAASSAGGAYGIVLAAPLGAEYIGAATLEEWYARKLTKEQRAFVSRGYERPVRLKGPAGSGKTLSMAVKSLRDLYAADDAGRDTSFAFLTHSSTVAEETLPGMFAALDPSSRWRNLNSAKLFVGSLYELAQAFLQYDQKSLRPLSIDGREGREFQYILIEGVIRDMLSSSRFVNSELRNLSLEFRAAIEDYEMSTRLIQEIMNEFACVIDADNVRLGTKRGERYIGASRESWQMLLPCPEDRETLLHIHDEYRKQLEASGVLSLDQMIADLNRYLEFHEWNQSRDRDGFDAVFVDELHYFNRAERMVFHNLFRKRATEGGKMPVFMSYDLKQSPTDALLGIGGTETASNFFQKLGAGSTELVELTKVFRSTPQITEFLRDLDATFPALDLEDEWSDYTATSDRDEGEVPELWDFATNTVLLDRVFFRAKRDVAEFSGKRVAVLCLDEELFDRYRKAGRIKDQHVPITGRDQVAELKYAGGRCVLSMPEYVAGLQFESVYLLHVDKAELVDASAGLRRRFISRCYLGASRAARKLVLASSRERGGPSEVLNVPLQRGSLIHRPNPV